jgi:hypothetical protein
MRFASNLLAVTRRAITILLVTDMLHPIHDLAVETFLNGNMRHRGSGRRAVPMFLAGRKPNHITRPDFFNRTAPTLCPPETCRDNERLSKRMSVPSRASAWFKSDARARGTCRIRRLEQ